MECIYLPDFDLESANIQIPSQELQHIKALRLKPNEKIFITNGTGTTAIAKISRAKNIFYIGDIEDIKFGVGELSFRLGLAIGALDNRDRMEFALEKSIELGVTDFYILKTKFSSPKNYYHERLISKSIAAMKQCKRSFLPNIYTCIDINNINNINIINNNSISNKNIKNIFSAYEKFILADENGNDPKSFLYKKETNMNTLVFIGPEGGFSQNETLFLAKNFNIEKIALANRRLRAETAAISALTLFSTMLV